MMVNQNFASAFIELSREKLKKNLLPKLTHCLSLLPEEEIWHRSNENVNSVGNIVLNLCGNVRQWIVSGIGGREDIRRRPEEFRRDLFIQKEELLSRIETVVEEADWVLSRFDPNQLGEKKTIQGFEVSCLSAIYHVVEHFSHHAGQVIHITKSVLNVDLGLTHLTPQGYNPKSNSITQSL